MLTLQFSILFNSTLLQTADQQAAKNSIGNELREVSTKRQNAQQITPKYVIIREPPTGPAEYLILEVTLPDYVSS